jgi:peptide/nickel transport system substrate-binding protein
MAWRQGASRRDLMHWLGAAGMSAAMSSAIIGDAKRALAQTPKRGGRIKVASQTSSTADTVDPAKQNNQTDYTRCFTFYNGLTRLDASLAPQLELAEAIETDGATVWTTASPRHQVPTTARRSAPTTSSTRWRATKDPATGRRPRPSPHR